MKRHIFLILLLGGFLATSLSAQVSGFRGRKFLLKSDFSSLILPDRSGRSLALEVVLLRNASIMVGYREFQHDIGEFRSLITYPSLKVSNQVFFLEGRKYFRQGLPAPLGRFMYVRYGHDRADMEGSLGLRLENDVTGELEDFDQIFRLSNLPGNQWEVGVGHQWIVFDRINLELAAGIMYTWYENPETYAAYLETARKTLGPNWGNLNIIDSSSWDQGGMGLTLSISAGVLLF